MPPKPVTRPSTGAAPLTARGAAPIIAAPAGSGAQGASSQSQVRASPGNQSGDPRPAGPSQGVTPQLNESAAPPAVRHPHGACVRDRYGAPAAPPSRGSDGRSAADRAPSHHSPTRP